MNTPQAGELLDSYLDANNIQIKDWKTREAIIAAMHLFAAMAVSEANDENVSIIKGIEDKDIALHTEAYLGEGDASVYFKAGAIWMRDKIIKLL